MNLTIVHYDGSIEYFKNVNSFEFRTNYNANWMRIETVNDGIFKVRNIATIKNE